MDFVACIANEAKIPFINKLDNVPTVTALRAPKSFVSGSLAVCQYTWLHSVPRTPYLTTKQRLPLTTIWGASLSLYNFVSVPKAAF